MNKFAVEQCSFSTEIPGKSIVWFLVKQVSTGKEMCRSEDKAMADYIAAYLERTDDF